MPRSLLFFRHKFQLGLTLREIFILLLIVTLAGAAVVPLVLSRLDDYRSQAVVQQLDDIARALERYKLDNHVYPSAEQGLAALLEKPLIPPEPRNWDAKGYLSSRQMPVDPWGNPYQYQDLNGGRGFTLLSYGSDGLPGGEGMAADISRTF